VNLEEGKKIQFIYEVQKYTNLTNVFLDKKIFGLENKVWPRPIKFLFSQVAFCFSKKVTVPKNSLFPLPFFVPQLKFFVVWLGMEKQGEKREIQKKYQKKPRRPEKWKKNAKIQKKNIKK